MKNVGKILSKAGSGNDLLSINHVAHLYGQVNCRILKFFKFNPGIHKMAGSILPHQKLKRDMPWKKAIESLGEYFLILLFTYASITKLLERDHFYLNLLNSPLLDIEKPWIITASWAIPFTELFIVFLLIFPKTKLKGLYISVGLLSLYTLYIMALLFLAPYQPCSCGGIIALFSWKQHLWFTLGCLIIAALTLYLKKSGQPKNL